MSTGGKTVWTERPGRSWNVVDGAEFDAVLEDNGKNLDVVCSLFLQNMG